MYFWRDKKLAHDLHKGFVSEKQKMLYLMVASLSYVFVMAISGLNIMEIEITFYDYLNQVIVFIGTIITILVPFKLNRQGDNKDFIARYICLGLPILVKSSIVAILPFFIDPLLFSSSAEYFLDETIQVDFEHQAKVAFVSILMTYSYILWRYTMCFKIASGQKEYGI